MNPAIGHWRGRLGLALLAAMVALPFLHPRHFNPIPSFWGEWWAVALGLAAAGVLLARSDAWRPARLPSVMLIPLIFCATAVIQIALRQVLFVEQALLFASMLLWAALLMLLGRQLRERFGLERIVDLLAAAMLAGALVNAGIALLQWLGDTAFASPWIFPRGPGHEPYGNLGQRNHLNHHMWLGIVSVAYLHLRGRLSPPLFWTAVAPLLLAATLTTSRSIFLYAALLPLLTWPLAQLGNPPADHRRWLRLTLPLLPAIVLLQWIVKNFSGWLAWIGAEATGQSLIVGSATARLFEEVSGTSIRMRLYAASWREFLDAPWFGNGIGTLPWKLFLANEQTAADWAPGVAEHAHNIVLHLLAEVGLVPSVLALVVLALWARRFFSGHWQLQQLWLAGMLGIAALHSLLEYPLWYAYFLGPAALLLGMSDAAALEVRNGWRGAVLVAAIVAAAAVPLATLRSDYAILEATLNRRHATATWQSEIDGLLRLQRNSLLSPQVLVTLAVAMEPTDAQLAAKIAVCEAAQRFAPSRHIVFKCAVLLQLARRDEDAARQWARSLRAFPESRAEALGEVRKMALRDPRLAPLAAAAGR